MKRLSREEAERQLRGARSEVLQRLPEDVDPELAAEVALALVTSHEFNPTWLFARRCRKLPPPVIRALLAKLPSVTPRRWWAVFLQEAVRDEGDDAQLSAHFLSALDALLDLQTTYAWGSKQRRAKLKALAVSPRFLAAVQAAVVGDEAAPLDLLAVLAADGSEPSIDALMPALSRAHAEQSELLDRLEHLETHAARTPAMETLLASDELGLGRCEAAQLPEWLSRAQVTLGIHWSTNDGCVSGLRGKKRDAFARWLFSRVR